jgi:hypothetical protein
MEGGRERGRQEGRKKGRSNYPQFAYDMILYSKKLKTLPKKC